MIILDMTKTDSAEPNSISRFQNELNVRAQTAFPDVADLVKNLQIFCQLAERHEFDLDGSLHLKGLTQMIIVGTDYEVILGHKKSKLSTEERQQLYDSACFIVGFAIVKPIEEVVLVLHRFGYEITRTLIRLKELASPSISDNVVNVPLFGIFNRNYIKNNELQKVLDFKEQQLFPNFVKEI